MEFNGDRFSLKTHHNAGMNITRSPWKALGSYILPLWSRLQLILMLVVQNLILFIFIFNSKLAASRGGGVMISNFNELGLICFRCIGMFLIILNQVPKWKVEDFSLYAVDEHTNRTSKLYLKVVKGRGRTQTWDWLMQISLVIFVVPSFRTSWLYWGQAGGRFYSTSV